MIPFQYLKNKQTGKIKSAGHCDFSINIPEGYEVIIGDLEDGYEMEAPILPVQDRIVNLFKTLPVELRVKLAPVSSVVLGAMATGDLELAKYLAMNAELPEGTEEFKSKIIQTLGE